jgi:F0F1-type ATP synthase assembly protein I
MKTTDLLREKKSSQRLVSEIITVIIIGLVLGYLLGVVIP